MRRVRTSDSFEPYGRSVIDSPELKRLPMMTWGERGRGGSQQRGWRGKERAEHFNRFETLKLLETLRFLEPILHLLSSVAQSPPSSSSSFTLLGENKRQSFDLFFTQSYLISPIELARCCKRLAIWNRLIGISFCLSRKGYQTENELKKLGPFLLSLSRRLSLTRYESVVVNNNLHRKVENRSCEVRRMSSSTREKNYSAAWSRLSQETFMRNRRLDSNVDQGGDEFDFSVLRTL